MRAENFLCQHVYVCVCVRLVSQFCSWGNHAKLIRFHLKPKRASIVLGLHFLYLSVSTTQNTGPSFHSTSQLCSICLLTLIYFPLLLNNRWIEQNNEFGIFRIIERVTCFFEPRSVVRLQGQSCAVTWGRIVFSTLKWIYSNFTILLFFHSPFAEMMVLQREGPKWLEVM